MQDRHNGRRSSVGRRTRTLPAFAPPNRSPSRFETGPDHPPSGDTKGPMTMNRLFRLGALAVAVVLSGGGLLARADDKAPKSHTHAVVVGVGTFADPEIKPRPTADEDARTIAGLLTDKAAGQVPSENVAVLL